MTYKGYRVEGLGTYSLFKIMPPGSGAIPAELSGHFTSTREAFQAIDRSLNGLKKGRTREQKKGGTTG